jgi:hypothetical protein
MTNTQSRTSAGPIAALTVVFVVGLALIVILSIFNVNIARERDDAQAVANDYMRDNMQLSRELEAYHWVDAMENEAKAKTLDAAFERCEILVTERMAGVVTDPLGNPIDVSTFAETTCEDDLDSVGRTAFIEKFPSQG